MAKLFKKPATGKKSSAEAPTKTEFKSYQSFQLQKRIKPTDRGGGLPSSFRLFGESLVLLKRHAKLFLGLAAVYGLLYLIFVQGMTALNGLDQTKNALEASATGVLASIAAGTILFTQLLGLPTTLSATANTYQFLVTIIASLALIWTLRQVHASNMPRIRDGFYQGMYPLIPFLLVLLVIILELLPMATGGAIFNAVMQNGIAVSGLEVALWATGFFVLAVISLYLMTSSIFALYIVGLPDMTPLPALRSARELVRGRRWQVLRKVLFLPAALLLIGGIIMVPIIWFATGISAWAFFVFILVGLAVAHTYLYKLYRSII